MGIIITGHSSGVILVSARHGHRQATDAGCLSAEAPSSPDSGLGPGPFS